MQCSAFRMLSHVQQLPVPAIHFNMLSFSEPFESDLAPVCWHLSPGGLLFFSVEIFKSGFFNMCNHTMVISLTMKTSSALSLYHVQN